ncbi:MAG: hypothetical protein ACREHG_02325 [Candidatus Saccharimonadales bacterium]
MSRFLMLFKFLAVGFSLALLINGCAHVPPKGQAKAEPEVKELPIPPEFKDSTEREFALGGVIKTYDDVAWLGTDAVMAAGYKPQSADHPVYVVEPTANDLKGMYQFSFITEKYGKLSVAAIADVDHQVGMGKVTGARVMSPGVEPSYQDTQMYAAYRAALDAPDLKLCNATYNHVVIPYGEGDNLEYRVYFLMSSNKKGVAPLGGHVLVRVARDAKTIIEVKPLAKSCMMSLNTDDKHVAALEFSDLALDSPSAAQVFLMLRYQLPVYLITRNQFLWAIDSRGIRLLSEGKNK